MTGYKPIGIFDDYPDKEYYDDPGIGASELKRFYNGSVAHAQTEQQQTDEMKLGTLVHRAVLEPDRWQDHLDAEPPHDFDNWRHERAAEALADGGDAEDVAESCNVSLSKAREYCGVAAVGEQAEHYRQHDPSDAVDVETADKVEAIRDSVFDYLEAANADAIVRDARAEVALFWEDNPTGARCRGKLDAVADTPEGAIVVDLKTTSRQLGNDDHAFRRKVGQRAYHIQAGHYCHGLEAHGETVDRWLWLAVETKEPYGVRLFELPPRDLDEAKSVAGETLEAYVDERNSDGYDGYEPEISTLKLPEWA